MCCSIPEAYIEGVVGQQGGKGGGGSIRWKMGASGVKGLIKGRWVGGEGVGQERDICECPAVSGSKA